MLGGLFPIYPVSTALGRTMVNVEGGSKTQVSRQENIDIISED